MKVLLAALIGLSLAGCDERDECIASLEESEMTGVLYYSPGDGLNGPSGYFFPSRSRDLIEEDFTNASLTNDLYDLDLRSQFLNNVKTYSNRGKNYVFLFGKWGGEAGVYKLDCESPTTGLKFFRIRYGSNISEIERTE